MQRLHQKEKHVRCVWPLPTSPYWGMAFYADSSSPPSLAHGCKYSDAGFAH